MAAIFSLAETDHLAGMPMAVAVGARPGSIAPRGPRGLWDAMARAAGARDEATALAPVGVDVSEPVPVGAHLAYLARVAATPVADVVDLAAYRAARRTC